LEVKNDFEDYLKKQNQTFKFLGITGGNNLKLNEKINFTLEKLIDLYYNTIPRIMNA